MQSALRLHFLQQGPFPRLRSHLGEGIPRQVLQDVLLGYPVQLNLLLQKLGYIPAVMTQMYAAYSNLKQTFNKNKVTVTFCSASVNPSTSGHSRYLCKGLTRCSGYIQQQTRRQLSWTS